ncbi:MAG TPA: Lrp/AsnC family transcriptional regulator [Candidatus Nanoarchaeia archaeon]|nr:Lrp/AsnC family transcriptional regulator [Candidatus Nanoarchaeia archaeon]
MNNVLTMEWDETDERILNELMANAKIPLRGLAKKIGVSFVTVMNRIKRLEKAGIITGYSARINYALLNYNVHALIEVRIVKGKFFDLERKLAAFPEIYAVYDTTGDFDATILGWFQSTRALDNCIKKMQTLDYVERTLTKIILNTIKEGQVRLHTPNKG